MSSFRYKENRIIKTACWTLCIGVLFSFLVISCEDIANPVSVADSGSLMITVNSVITGNEDANVFNGLYNIQLLDLEPVSYRADTLLLWTPASWDAGTPDVLIADVLRGTSFLADTSLVFEDEITGLFAFPPGGYTTNSGRIAGIAPPGDYHVRFTVPAECEVDGERQVIVPVTIPTFETAGMTFDVDCTASGDISTNDSSVAAPGTHDITGPNPAIVTIKLRDGNGNPVGGLRDADFSIDVTGSAVAGQVFEEITGRTAKIYTVGITNEIAETVTVAVTANGIPLDDIVEITFVES